MINTPAGLLPRSASEHASLEASCCQKCIVLTEFGHIMIFGKLRLLLFDKHMMDTSSRCHVKQAVGPPVCAHEMTYRCADILLL